MGPWCSGASVMYNMWFFVCHNSSVLPNEKAGSTGRMYLLQAQHASLAPVRPAAHGQQRLKAQHQACAPCFLEWHASVGCTNAWGGKALQACVARAQAAHPLCHASTSPLDGLRGPPFVQIPKLNGAIAVSAARESQSEGSTRMGSISCVRSRVDKHASAPNALPCCSRPGLRDAPREQVGAAEEGQGLDVSLVRPEHCVGWGCCRLPCHGLMLAWLSLCHCCAAHCKWVRFLLLLHAWLLCSCVCAGEAALAKERTGHSM